MSRRRSYDEWYALAEKACLALCGLSLSDLPDVCFMDWYEDGVSPAACAKRAIRNAGGDF
jgi:hypothetical protein